jgi:hypothetical protein
VESISFLFPFFLAVDISRQIPTLAATTSTGSEKGRIFVSDVIAGKLTRIVCGLGRYPSPTV